MVVRFRKKVKKQRGKRWHGYGAKKKHRGAGNRGGRGRAGLWKHKKSLVAKLGIVLGKRGFSRPVKKRDETITLRELEALAERSGKTELDLGEFGYRKLISQGTVSRPLVVKVDKVTERARAKIEQAGGKVISG